MTASCVCLQELNIEDVDKTMEEINEAQDQMQQMNDVLSQPIGAAADLDEDELAAELRVRHGCSANFDLQCCLLNQGHFQFGVMGARQCTTVVHNL